MSDLAGSAAVLGGTARALQVFIFAKEDEARGTCNLIECKIHCFGAQSWSSEKKKNRLRVIPELKCRRKRRKWWEKQDCFRFFFHTLKGKIVERYDERRKGKVSKTNDSFFLSMVSATQEDNERDRREATMRKTKETNKTNSAL